MCGDTRRSGGPVPVFHGFKYLPRFSPFSLKLPFIFLSFCPLALSQTEIETNDGYD